MQIARYHITYHESTANLCGGVLLTVLYCEAPSEQNRSKAQKARQYHEMLLSFVIDGLIPSVF